MPLLYLALFLLATLPAAAQIDSFRVVGVHPGAAAQATAVGRIVNALVAFEGRLYAGYGDYSANTGPIAVMELDPATGIFTDVLSANTEALYNFRAIGGRLFAPSIDRKSNVEPGDYIVRENDGVWRNRDIGSTTTHAYDIATRDGGDLWLAGSQGARATLWRSTNDGADWSIALVDSAIAGEGDFSRFYFIGVLDGRLYLQTRDGSGSLHPVSHLFDGTTWSRGPDLFPGVPTAHGWRPDTFAGRLVYRSREPRTSYSQLFSFDGTTARWHDDFWVYDITIAGGSLYALVDSGFGVLRIMRTDDLESWTSVARAPSGARSIAILDGRIYLGTVDSEIIEYIGSFSDLPEERNGASGIELRSSLVTSHVEAVWSREGISPDRFVVLDPVGRTMGEGAIPAGVEHIRWSSAALDAGVYFFSLYDRRGVRLVTFPFLRKRE